MMSFSLTADLSYEKRKNCIFVYAVLLASHRYVPVCHMLSLEYLSPGRSSQFRDQRNAPKCPSTWPLSNPIPNP